MDTRGNIQQFPTSIEALADGFDTHLTPDQAKALQGLPQEQRQAALVRIRNAKHAMRKRGRELAALDAQGRANRKANELRRKRSKAARRARKRNRRQR